MKQELKSAWIENLTSGKYIQGQSMLCSIQEDGTKWYCCLGVLVDISDIEWETDEDGNEAGVSTYQNTSSLYDATLVEHGELQKWALDELGLLEVQQSKLVNMNDTDRASFAEIAAWIENNVKVDE